MVRLRLVPHKSDSPSSSRREVSNCSTLPVTVSLIIQRSWATESRALWFPSKMSFRSTLSSLTVIVARSPRFKSARRDTAEAMTLSTWRGPSLMDLPSWWPCLKRAMTGELVDQYKFARSPVRTPLRQRASLDGATVQTSKSPQKMVKSSWTSLLNPSTLTK